MADYRDVNRANWDERVPAHAASPDYAVERFSEDPAFLSGVVTFDLPRLGSVAGADGVHLQCHIGTDTLSLARLGARMTGLDFSPSALSVARRLAEECRTSIEYVEADLYDAVTALGAGRFDLVFTGIGALCWLPSVARWATVVAELLRPAGRLFLREGHPMLWSLCEPRDDELVVVEYPYFERPEGTPFSDTKTYVEHEGEVGSPETISWNHGLGEIITALMAAGLELTALEEHRSVPWNALGTAMVALPNGE